MSPSASTPSIKINAYFKDKGNTNVTIVSDDDEYFYVEDFFLKATSITFRDILSLPTEQDGLDQRPEIKVAEEGWLTRDLLLLMIYEDKMVTPLLKERSAEELRELIIAMEKYQMDPCPLPVRKAIQSHWDVEDPVSALRQAAPWRDAGSIAFILASGAVWNQYVRREMTPWCLPEDIVQDMGVTLYRSYVRAYCLNVKVPPTIIGEVLWDGEDEFALEPYGIETGLDHQACAGELIRQAE